MSENIFGIYRIITTRDGGVPEIYNHSITYNGNEVDLSMGAIPKSVISEIENHLELMEKDHKLNKLETMATIEI